MDGIKVGYGVGVGIPVCRPGEVYADSAYDSRAIRLYLRRRGIRASIIHTFKSYAWVEVKAYEAI